jgi:hypothetical protein
MYLAVFDEWAHHVSEYKVNQVSKALLAATERVVTQTRKTMQGMLLVGQATGLVLGFGNNQNIRTQCQAGYMIAHRNNNESGRQVFGNGLTVDPSKIPMGLYGAGFAASVVDQRDAMTRTEWVEHPGLVAHEIDIPPVPADELAILMRGLSIAGGLPLESPLAAALTAADAAGEAKVVSGRRRGGAAHPDRHQHPRQRPAQGGHEGVGAGAGAARAARRVRRGVRGEKAGRLPIQGRQGAG